MCINDFYSPLLVVTEVTGVGRKLSWFLCGAGVLITKSVSAGLAVIITGHTVVVVVEDVVVVPPTTFVDSKLCNWAVDEASVLFHILPLPVDESAANVMFFCRL